MSEHHETVIVKAPVEHVYNFFTHFNDFPKFMTFIKEVTYYDDQRSHWVAQVVGTQEWDAINENWIPNVQVGWRSTSGLKNSGAVRFTSLSADSTSVDVYLSYTPPAGALGEVVDKLSTEHYFAEILRRDLNNFARMVEEAPPGALDPMQSHYLFHENSAAAKNDLTPRQKESMQADPMMSDNALQARSRTVQEEEQQQQEAHQQQEMALQQEHQRQQAAIQQQEEVLRRQAESDVASQVSRIQPEEEPERPLDPVYDTIGGRNASMDRTAIGDKDGRTERFPEHYRDPMTSRAPHKRTDEDEADVDPTIESPWRTSMLGRETGSQEPNTPPEEP
jgi:hypothetical protein